MGLICLLCHTKIARNYEDCKLSYLYNFKNLQNPMYPKAKRDVKNTLESKDIH